MPGVISARSGTINGREEGTIDCMIGGCWRSDHRDLGRKERDLFWPFVLFQLFGDDSAMYSNSSIITSGAHSGESIRVCCTYLGTS